MAKEFWTIRELATKMNRPYSTVYRWVELGYVSAVRFERKLSGKRTTVFYRIPVQECRRIIESSSKGLVYERA